MSEFIPIVPEISEVISSKKQMLPLYAENLSDYVMEKFNKAINSDILNIGMFTVSDKVERTFECVGPSLTKEEKEGFFTGYVTKDSCYSERTCSAKNMINEQRELIKFINKNNFSNKTIYKIRMLVEYKFIGSIFGFQDDNDIWTNLEEDAKFPSKFTGEIEEKLKELYPIQYKLYEKFYTLISEYNNKKYNLSVYHKKVSYNKECIFTDSLMISY